MTAEYEDNSEERRSEDNGQPNRLRVSMRQKTVDVDIEQEDGTFKTYRLVEMMGDERDAFLNEQMKRTKYNKKTGSAVGIKRIDMIIPDLISRCLHDENGKRIPKFIIQKKIPSGSQAILFDECQRLCGLTLESQDDEKND